MSALISFNFDMTDCSTSCFIYISFHPKGVLLGICGHRGVGLASPLQTLDLFQTKICNNNNNNDDDDDDNNTFI